MRASDRALRFISRINTRLRSSIHPFCERVHMGRASRPTAELTPLLIHDLRSSHPIRKSMLDGPKRSGRRSSSDRLRRRQSVAECAVRAHAAWNRTCSKLVYSRRADRHRAERKLQQ
jgi:hypothetical protein